MSPADPDVLAGSRLIAASMDRWTEFQAMGREMQAAGDAGYDGWFGYLGVRYGDWRALLGALLAMAQPTRADLVPSNVYWLVDATGELLGEAHIRWRLNATLLHHGGHIGYMLRPTARGQGFGHRILALTLQAAHAGGLRRVLLTCDRTNLASAAVIRGAGGLLEDEPRSRLTGRTISRYWINLAGSDNTAPSESTVPD